ncbi:hypothetical protein CXB51_019810 [Gossypium anomalum]|uniref:Uncharacterized protein n=1 Tax=Gossypium anomalum TaxID=47600 RepID=A0A8J5YLE0_9ROSI|nr:hypothetical protein CXB51_019810 [Gossypium anomalum]
MSCRAMAQLLSNTLYYYNLQALVSSLFLLMFLGALITKGCVFTYDAIGSYERVRYSSQECVSPLMEAEAVDLVKTVFASASEEISTLFVLFVIVLVIGYLRKDVFSILEPQY